VRRGCTLLVAGFAATALAGCSQIAALAPVGGDTVASVRYAVIDVLLAHDVAVLEAPTCVQDTAAISCTGSVVGGGAISASAVSPTPSPSPGPQDDAPDLVLEVIVDGESLYSGSLQSVIDEAVRP
jgi:hypothetical protein